MDTKTLAVLILAVCVALSVHARQNQAAGEHLAAQPGQNGKQPRQEQPQGTEAKLYLSPSAIRDIQLKLEAFGYNPGYINGVWDGQTMQAARRFQWERELEPTGNLNMRTLAALGVGQLLLGFQEEAGVTPNVARELAQHKGTIIYASPATVRQVQFALKNAGYPPGNTQGKWDRQTALALRNFQQTRELEPTGNLNLLTIADLGLREMTTRFTQNRYNIDRQLAWEPEIGPGTPLYVSPAGLRQIQEALNLLGYDVGPASGKWDRATARGVKEFQEARSLEPTGNVNMRTIRTLGMGQIFADTMGIGGPGRGPIFGRPQQQQQQFGAQSRQQQGGQQSSQW